MSFIRQSVRRCISTQLAQSSLNRFQMDAKTWTAPQLEAKLLKLHHPQYVWSQLVGTPFQALVPTAVLIPLAIHDGDVLLWLTLRAQHLRHDGGHVAFPGGKKDEEDEDEIATCLRESMEEIGLDSHQVKTVAVLPPRLNARRFLITPVVGIVDTAFRPRPNHEEVAKVFQVPLSRFLSEERHSANPYTFRGVDMNNHVFHDDIDGELVRTWGLTASMCIETAAAVFNREPDFAYSPHTQVDPADPFAEQRRYLDQFARQKGKL